jgi:hypothetical protein
MIPVDTYIHGKIFSTVMRKTALFVSVLFLYLYVFQTDIHAQKWADRYMKKQFETMCIEYRCPDGFDEILHRERFEFKPLLMKAMGFGASLILRSKDGHCTVFTHIESILTPENAKKYSRGEFAVKEDEEYIAAIRRILYVKGEDVRNSWKKHIQYCPAEEAKLKFNADTAVFFSFILSDSDAYQDVYNYCKVLIIRKKGRGYLPLYCMYDAKAAGNIDAYLTAIESAFKYVDCIKPLYSQPEPLNDSTLFIDEIKVKIKNNIPSDAVILFDGNNMSKWENVDGSKANWTFDGGILKSGAKNNIQTVQKFDNCQLHIEWKGDASRNTSTVFCFSSILFQKQYQVVMMPAEKDIDTEYSGNLFNKSAMVRAYDNECEWQVFDIVFLAPRFSIDGKLEKQARITVFLNGVLVQYDVSVEPLSAIKQYPAHAELPLELVKSDGFEFKNIWIREFKTDDK